jgi:hypothetical protein
MLILSPFLFPFNLAIFPSVPVFRKEKILKRVVVVGTVETEENVGIACYTVNPPGESLWKTCIEFQRISTTFDL